MSTKCTDSSQCKPILQYCDTVTVFCNECEVLCNPHKKLTTECQSHCKAYMDDLAKRNQNTTASPAKESNMPELKPGDIQSNINFVFIGLATALAVILLILIVVIFVLFYQKKKKKHHLEKSESKNLLGKDKKSVFVPGVCAGKLVSMDTNKEADMKSLETSLLSIADGTKCSVINVQNNTMVDVEKGYVQDRPSQRTWMDLMEDQKSSNPESSLFKIYGQESPDRVHNSPERVHNSPERVHNSSDIVINSPDREDESKKGMHHSNKGENISKNMQLTSNEGLNLDSKSRISNHTSTKVQSSLNNVQTSTNQDQKSHHESQRSFNKGQSLCCESAEHRKFPETVDTSMQTSIESKVILSPILNNTKCASLNTKQRDKETYDALRGVPWVEGYYSEGASIQVFVDLTTIDEPWALNQLTEITGQLPHRFHIKDSAEIN